MTDPDAELEVLLPHLARLAASVPRLNDSLFISSAQDLLQPIPALASALHLRTLRFDWHFRLARSGSRRFLIIFREDSPETILFDSAFRFRLEPNPAPWSGPSISPADVSCELVLPYFIHLRPAIEDMQRFAPPGATWRDTILLRLGPTPEDVLAVQHPQEGPEDARIKLGGYNMAGPPWPVAPFLDFTEKLREWVTTKPARGESFFFPPPTGLEDEPIHEVFFQMLTAACVVTNGLAKQSDSSSDADDIFKSMRTSFALDAFESEVMLRLRPDGQFAERMDEEMFHLAFECRIATAEAGLAARVCLRPPDFLVEGELHNDFLDLFTTDDIIAEIASDLNVTVAKAEIFLRDLGSRASIFRVKRRGELDTNVLAARALLEGRPVAVMLRGDFQVDHRSKERRLVRRKSSIENLYTGPAEAHVRGLDNKDVRYFLGLIAAFHQILLILK